MSNAICVAKVREKQRSGPQIDTDTHRSEEVADAARVALPWTCPFPKHLRSSVLQSVTISPCRHDSPSAVIREKAIGQRNVWQRNGKKVFRFYSSDNHSSDTFVHRLEISKSLLAIPLPMIPLPPLPCSFFILVSIAASRCANLWLNIFSVLMVRHGRGTASADTNSRVYFIPRARYAAA